MATIPVPMARARREGEPWSLWSLSLARSVDESLHDVETVDELAGRLALLVGPLEVSAIRPVADSSRVLASALSAKLELAEQTRLNGTARSLVLLDTVANTGVQLSSALVGALNEEWDTIVGMAVLAQSDVVNQWQVLNRQLVALEVI